MKKPFVITACIIILLAGTIVLAQKPEILTKFIETTSNIAFTNSKSAKSNNEQVSLQNSSTIQQSAIEIQRNIVNNETPDHIFYDMFFNMVKSFDVAGSNGGNRAMWRDYIKNRTGFNDQQMTQVRRVTDDFFTAIRPIHEQAMQIIANRRAANSEGSTPPAPSLELRALQEQRETLALAYGNRLRTSLGNEATEQLRQRMQQDYGIQPNSSDEDLQMLHERLQQFRNNQGNSDQTQGGNNNE